MMEMAHVRDYYCGLHPFDMPPRSRRMKNTADAAAAAVSVWSGVWCAAAYFFCCLPKDLWNWNWNWNHHNPHSLRQMMTSWYHPHYWGCRCR